MPFLRAEAPPHVPDEETIEYLLGEENKSSKRAAKVSPLQDLKPDVRQRTGLITLGKLQKRIQGDPWGYYFSWAGNVSHPYDMRVVGTLLLRVNNIINHSENRKTSWSPFARKYSSTKSKRQMM